VFGKKSNKNKNKNEKEEKLLWIRLGRRNTMSFLTYDLPMPMVIESAISHAKNKFPDWKMLYGCSLPLSETGLPINGEQK